MGRALEVISGYVTAPSTTHTALTMCSGNSATIRNAAVGSEIHLLQAWAKSQTAGEFRIMSPKLHDNVEGIQLYSTAARPVPLLPSYFRQRLYPQDTLTLDLTGSATAGDLELASILVGHEDLPGISGRFITAEQLYMSGVNILTVQNTLASGTTGDYTGEEAINAETDLLKANTDYALVGYLNAVLCGTIRWRGADFGNLGLGGPGAILDRAVTRDWFLHISRQFGAAWIPVFNSANKANVLIDCQQDEDGADPIVTSILVELEPGAAPAA